GRHRQGARSRVLSVGMLRFGASETMASGSSAPAARWRLILYRLDPEPRGVPWRQGKITRAAYRPTGVFGAGDTTTTRRLAMAGRLTSERRLWCRRRPPGSLCPPDIVTRAGCAPTRAFGAGVRTAQVSLETVPR